jgi:hypothetical protein
VPAVESRGVGTDSTAQRTPEGLRRIVPGRLYSIVRIASWVELCLFAGLLIVWLAPGLHHATFIFGLAHGIGFIVLALLVIVAVLRHEAPYILLAATMTPVGPVGSVIAIAYLDRQPPRTPGRGSSMGMPEA